jgi:hypothetical protein
MATSSSRCQNVPRHDNRCIQESDIMSLFPREEILKRLRAKVAAGQPIIGGGAGTGLSAKLEEAGGIDLIAWRAEDRWRG